MSTINPTFLKKAIEEIANEMIKKNLPLTEEVIGKILQERLNAMCELYTHHYEKGDKSIINKLLLPKLK